MSVATIRDATVADLSALIPVHEEAFAGTLGVRLGPRYITRFLRAFVEMDDALVLVAELDGAIVGYVFGVATARGGEVTRAVLPHVVAAVARRPHLLVHRYLIPQLPSRIRGLVRSRRAPAPDTDGVLDLWGIGVSPAARRRAVAAALLDGYERRAWERGFHAIRLNVHDDNTAAIALYTGRGWRRVEAPGPTPEYRIDRPDGR